MKIAITGHTRGIGFGLAEAFRGRGDQVFGYSRATDYDLANYITVDRIVSSVHMNECDVLIINAHYQYSQTRLLYSIDTIWANCPDKTIVTISSNSADGTKNWAHPYAIQKGALDKTVEQLQNCRPYRLINIRPGYVDTPRVAEITQPKIGMDEIVKTVLWTIDIPNTVLVRNLTITPR